MYARATKGYECIMKTTVKSIMLVIAATVLCASIGAPAGAVVRERDQQVLASQDQVAVDPRTGAQRSAVPVQGQGLKLNMVEGDEISIEGDAVTWTDSAGLIVARIDITSPDSGMTFYFDESTQMIREEGASFVSPDLPQGYCMPKWIGWAFNIAWGGLVCLPASAGASGVATPIAGAATAAACEAAGGALVTAISC
jgi:hypothetical protein